MHDAQQGLGMIIRIPQLKRHIRVAPIAILCIALFSLCALAQQPATPVAQITLKPSESALQFNSVFDRYQSFKSEKVGSWRDANDTVNRVGGWREYLKQSQQPEATETITPKPSSPPATTTNVPASLEPTPTAVKPNPHAGHGVKP
jgi:hypothetical protein